MTTYKQALEPHIEQFKEQINKNNKIEMKIDDLKIALGPEFIDRNNTSVYGMVKNILFENGIKAKRLDNILYMSNLTRNGVSNKDIESYQRYQTITEGQRQKIQQINELLKNSKIEKFPLSLMKLMAVRSTRTSKELPKEQRIIVNKKDIQKILGVSDNSTIKKHLIKLGFHHTKVVIDQIYFNYIDPQLDQGYGGTRGGNNKSRRHV